MLDAQMTIETTTYETKWVPEAKLPAMMDKLKKLNRRAAKLGMEPVTATVIGKKTTEVEDGTWYSYTKRVQTQHGAYWGHFVDYVELKIEGEAPKLGGYEFIAVLDHTQGDKPIMRVAPMHGEVDLSSYEEADCWCDHCQSRRRRNETLIIRETATQKLLQIGRNCGVDFFGTKNAASRIQVWDYDLSVSDEDGYAFYGGKYERVANIEHMFAVASAVEKKFGWVNTKMAERDETLKLSKFRVHENLWPYEKMPLEAFVKVEEDDIERGKAALAWLRERMEGRAKNSFEHNVKALLEHEVVSARYVAYLVWAMDGYLRSLVEQEQKKALSNAHFGEIGKRYELELTLKFRRSFDSPYGTQYLLVLVDAEGNSFKWKSSADAAYLMPIDTPLKCKATIKAHDEYEGKATTILTRAKFADADSWEE